VATAVRRAPALARPLRTASTARAPRVARAPQAAARSHGHGRALAIAAVATIVALVFAVVFHVILAQSQLQLDGMSTQIAKAQHTYEARRLELAKMSAPERIIGEAERLGLVLPHDPPTYLTVEGAPTPASETEQPSTTLSDWKAVKPHLGDPQP
jgi:cell division protein FtsL